MTERLYYTESYLTEFEALVIDVASEAGRAAVVLDRTAFYPTSGGQPFDTGTIDTAQVLGVVEREDGRVAHLVDVPPARGARVRGCVDWPRRFDHMQQHTGQHLLSAAFERTCAARTASFHLGPAASTIDLDRELAPDAVRAAEGEANRVVWENRPVTIRLVDASEAAGLPLRKEPARAGPLRLIEIQDYDLSACGGTHVDRTGAVGLIALTGSERFKGGLRVSFVCGGRALTSHRTLRAAIDGSVRLLSVLPGELPAAIDRLQAAGRQFRRELRALQTRLAAFEAEDLAAQAVETGLARLVAGAVSGYDAGGLKALAVAVGVRPGHAAVLIAPSSGGEGEGRWLVVVARAADLADVDAGRLLRELTARFGGRGGGSAEVAQGGGLQGSAEDILAAVRAYFTG